VSFDDSDSAPVSYTVGKVGTATTVAASDSSVVAGQPVTFTATVQGADPDAGTPTGSVTFMIDGVQQLPPVPMTDDGQAQLTGVVLSAGHHTIAAVYSGDANFAGSATGVSSLSYSVGKASSSTAVTASSSAPVAGQAVTFTATVAAGTPGASTPTGAVTFMDGATLLGTGTLSLDPSSGQVRAILSVTT